MICVAVVFAVSRSAPACHRNHSDFPDGDRDGNRDAERSNMTTNRFHYGVSAWGIQGPVCKSVNINHSQVKLTMNAEADTDSAYAASSPGL